MNKKGDYKWGIMLSLILGLMVLSLSLYFIFNELWTGDEEARQICRQSIQLRNLLPESKYMGFNLKSFKSEYPLKCKTHVVEIDESDVRDIERAEKIIAENIVECWALYDKGDASAFPSDFYSVASTCVPCARIHLTNEAKEYMNQNSVEINIRDSLDLQMNKGFSYRTYLKNAGEKFPAFNPASAREFNLSGDNFKVDISDYKNAVLLNRLTGGTENRGLEKIKNVWSPLDVSRVDLPMMFDSSKGDLLIGYGIITSAEKSDIGDYIPYLFYFQTA